MKKTLVLAILVVSVTAYSQTIHHRPKSMEGIHFRMELQVLEGTDFKSVWNFEQSVHQQSQNQRDLIHITDSNYHWLWDTLTAGWRLNGRLINMVYDDHYNLLSFTGQVRSSDTEWRNFYHRINTYDARNNLVNIIFQYWNGNSWVNSIQNTFTIDANNNQTNIEPSLKRGFKKN